MFGKRYMMGAAGALLEASPEGLLADIGQDMSMVVDPGLRARLTGAYLGLLKAYHARQVGGNFNKLVQELHRQVKAGLVQYKLEPGLGDASERVEQSLEAAMASIKRLALLASRQRDLATRRTWEARIEALTHQLNRVDNEMDLATSQVNLSRLSALAGTVDNLVAVQMMPTEVAWSQALGLRPPVFVPGSRVESGAQVIQAGYFRGLSGEADDMLAAFNITATDMWNQQAADAQKKAAVVMGWFTESCTRLKKLLGRLEGQRQWANRLNDPVLVQDWQQRKLDAGGLKGQLQSLATALKRATYDRWDSPEQTLRRELGELNREQSAAALLYSRYAAQVLTNIKNQEKKADAFDAQVRAHPKARALSTQLKTFGVRMGRE